MKVVKIKKKYFSDLAFMYRDLGLVDQNNRVKPEKVFASKEDLKKMEKALKARVKKENSIINSLKIHMVVQLELLNLGPNEAAKNAIRPGYLLILD